MNHSVGPNPVQPPAAYSMPRKTPAWVWAFRIFRWSTYLLALVTILLILHKVPPPPVEASPQAAQRAEEKFALAQESSAQGQQATLRLNETELNSYLGSILDLKPGSATVTQEQNPALADAEALARATGSTVRDLKVQMEGDLVKAYVIFDLHGKDLSLQLSGRLHATDGVLQFDPVSGQIGSLPIPHSSLKSAMQRLLESSENREKLRLPEGIEDLHVENGELVATYK